jgi:endonuclease-3
MQTKKNIIEVMNILEENFKHKERTTLNRMRGKSDAFKILIACLLSSRAKDEVTEKISEELFKIADTPEKISKLQTKKLEKIIFSTGHYHKKARILKHISKDLIKRFNGKVPDNKEDLISIKGIGQKTSNIVLNFAFDKEAIPIDTHCHRLPNRIGWIKTKNADETEIEIMKILPKKYWKEFNGIFVLFGRTICVPVSPFCSKCPIKNYCKRVGVGKSR